MTIQLPETLEGCHDLIKQLVNLTETLVARVEKLGQENGELKPTFRTNVEDFYN